MLTIVFFVIRVLPGDPAIAALGDYASKEAVDALRQRMGLNVPLFVQYFRFLGGLLQGDLGNIVDYRPPCFRANRGCAPLFA